MTRKRCNVEGCKRLQRLAYMGSLFMGGGKRVTTRYALCVPCSEQHDRQYPLKPRALIVASVKP